MHKVQPEDSYSAQVGSKDSSASLVMSSPKSRCCKNTIILQFLRVLDPKKWGIHATKPTTAQREKISSSSPEKLKHASLACSVVVWRTSATAVLQIPGLLLIFAGIARFVLTKGNNEKQFSVLFQSQVDEFFPGEIYDNLRSELNSIIIMFDAFFLSLFITDLMRLVAAAMCSVSAFVSFLKRYDYRSSAKWARRSWLIGFTLPFLLGLCVPHVAIIDWKAVHYKTCLTSIREAVVLLPFPFFKEEDGTLKLLQDSSAAVHTVSATKALDIPDFDTYCSSFSDDTWGQDLADRIDEYLTFQETAFDPPLSEGAYCYLGVREQIMSSHGITQAEYELYVDTDASTLRTSSEYNAIGSEQGKSDVLAWSMDRNREQTSMTRTCIAQALAYPSNLKVLQIAIVAMSKLVVSTQGLIAITMGLRAFFNIAPLVLSLLGGIHEAAVNFKAFLPHIPSSGYIIVAIPLLVAPYLAAYCGIVVQLFGDFFVTFGMLFLVASCFTTAYFKSLLQPMTRKEFTKKISKAGIPIFTMRLLALVLLVAGVFASSLISAEDLLLSFDIKEHIASILFLLFNFLFKTLLSTIVGLDSMISLSLTHFRSRSTLDTSVTTLEKGIFTDLLVLQPSSLQEYSKSLSAEDLYPRSNPKK